MGSNAKIKKDPQKAMESAEQMLNVNIENVTALEVLGSASEELGVIFNSCFCL